MDSIEKSIDVSLSLDSDGKARISFYEPSSGDDYSIAFDYPEPDANENEERAKKIGYEILSWFETMGFALDYRGGKNNKEE